MKNIVCTVKWVNMYIKAEEETKGGNLVWCSVQEFDVPGYVVRSERFVVGCDDVACICWLKNVSSCGAAHRILTKGEKSWRLYNRGGSGVLQ